MAKCTSEINLEIYLKNSNGENNAANAELLCEKCHAARANDGVSGQTPASLPFDEQSEVIIMAGGQCECTRSGSCH
jgi:5-methylcytosine-specific restriction endonuclease McrA